MRKKRIKRETYHFSDNGIEALHSPWTQRDELLADSRASVETIGDMDKDLADEKVTVVETGVVTGIETLENVSKKDTEKREVAGGVPGSEGTRSRTDRP